MLRRITIAGAIAIVLGCLLGTGSAVAADGGCARAAAVADDTTLSQATDAVLCLVNSERSQRGLGLLRASSELTTSARAHSFDMVRRQYFSHVTPNGSGVRQRAERAGYMRDGQVGKVGETIAWGTEQLGTPAELVRSFMASPGHRRVMLDKAYRDVGIGLVLGAPVDVSGAGATLTLNFGRR
jgi:uncharacterized protein YkwD